MSWLHVRVFEGRCIGPQPDPSRADGGWPIIEEIWQRVPRTARVRWLAVQALTDAGYDVAPILHPWDGTYPHEVSAFLCMKRGGGRAGSSIETLKVRRKGSSR